MDVVGGEWVRWVWGLTCDFAGVFEGVFEQKNGMGDEQAFRFNNRAKTIRNDAVSQSSEK